MFIAIPLIHFLYFTVDAASESTYYDEYDPFDYLYSCGTQYSDPVYEAVNKIDCHLNLSSGNEIYSNLDEPQQHQGFHSISNGKQQYCELSF